MTNNRFEPLRWGTARVTQIYFMVFSLIAEIISIALGMNEIFHRNDAVRFIIVRADVHDLYGKPFMIYI